MNERKLTAREQILELIASGLPASSLEEQLQRFDSADLVHAVFQLAPDEQRRLLSTISAEKAAQLVDEFPSAHGASLIEEMPAEEVALILEEMASDHRVDLLSEAFIRNEQREAMLLTCNAEQRYQWLLENEADLLQRVAQFHIASYLGIDAVSLSRLKPKIKG